MYRKTEDLTPQQQEEDITSIVFPDSFKFQTEQSVDVEIIDTESGAAVYELIYVFEGSEFSLGRFVKTSSGLNASITLPSVIENIKFKKKTSKETNLYDLPIQAGRISLTLNSISSSVANDGCVDELFAVNDNGYFFKIDLMNGNYDKTNMPDLQGGGSVANTLDQENGIMYYNVNRTLYKYDIASGSFSAQFTSNPYNGSYPRLAYKDGFFYISNNNTMHKVDAATNETVASYSIAGFVNSYDGGDLAFSTDGDLYLACFSGLYKFMDINDATGRLQSQEFHLRISHTI